MQAWIPSQTVNTAFSPSPPLEDHKQVNLTLQISINLCFTAGMAWHETTFVSPDDPRPSKEAAFRQVCDYPWCSSAILDLLKANRSKLGIIYVNPALVPWTLCTVSSCVHEFWSQLYLLLSTLSRSTSWPPCVSGRGERQMNTRREGFTCCTAAFLLSLCLMTEAIWQLHYLFLLFFTRGLASTQDQTTHAQTAHRSRFLPTTLEAVCWRLVVEALVSVLLMHCKKLRFRIMLCFVF